MSSLRIPTLIVAALGIGIAVTPARATLTGHGPANSGFVDIVEPMQDAARAPAGHARRERDRLLHLAIQWSGSNGGDDTPTENDPF
jgi:hypothetical protein